MELGDELSGLADAELVSRARSGQDAPYAELFRRHQPAAIALARTLTDRAAADDVVAEAFEKLLMRIRAGGGPQSAFRPYLLQTVRTVSVDAARRTRHLVVADDPEAVADPDAEPDDSLFDRVYEKTTLARAFGALPDRWQTFLWLSFVEGADRGEIATILGINVGGVSALGYRAREGLRRAYLDAHLVSAPTRGCSEIWPMLSGAVRGGLTPIQRKRVDEHVGLCEYCRGALAELDSVNHELGVLLAPLVLGAAAPAYLDVLGQAHGAGTAAGSLGYGSVEVGTVAKASIASLVKGGAASLAVVASTSTVALVAMIAVFTAPLGSEPSAEAGPDQVTSDVARELGGQPTIAGDTSSDSTTGASVTPAVATSPGAPTSGATGGGDRRQTPRGTRPPPAVRPRPASPPAAHDVADRSTDDRRTHHGADGRPDRRTDGRQPDAHRRADLRPHRRRLAHRLPDRHADVVRHRRADPGADPVQRRHGPGRQHEPYAPPRHAGSADERLGSRLPERRHGGPPDGGDGARDVELRRGDRAGVRRLDLRGDHADGRQPQDRQARLPAAQRGAERRPGLRAERQVRRRRRVADGGPQRPGPGGRRQLG